MSPLRKLIDRITGGEEAPSCLTLRAYGKLPESREFLHLEAGQAIPKLYQDWVKAGHDHWVRIVPQDHRGTLLPYRLFTALPGARDRGILALIRKSQDSATRVFPFTFFVVLRRHRDLSPLARLALAQYCWCRLEPLFADLQQGTRSLQSLREHAIAVTESELAAQSDGLLQQAQAVALVSWLDSAARAMGAKPAELLRRLRAMLQSWREHGVEGDLSLRLPLSREHDYVTQTAVWLQWLGVQHAGRPALVTGLFLPQPLPDVEAAVTVVTRPLRAGDLQLLTSDAARYEYVEDLTRRSEPPAGGECQPEDGIQDWLSNDLSLWDWANRRLDTSL